MDQVPFSDVVRFDVGVTGDDLRYQWFFNGTPLANAIGSSLSITKPGLENIGNYLVKVFQNSRLVESRLATLQFSHLGIDNVPTNKFARDKFADAVVRPVTRGGGLAPSELEESAEGNGASSVVLGYTGTQIFSTVGFGTEDGEISHCGIPGGASAWFVFQAPANGTLYLNTDGSDFNTVLAIYTGPGPLLSSLTAVACDNNSGANGLTSSLSINASSNTIYYIAVDGVNGATGLAYLNYRLLVPTVLTRVAKMNESTLRFRITTTPSYPFSIQRSGSLLSWATLVVTNTPTGTMVLQDTNATPAKRYYRAVQTP